MSCPNWAELLAHRSSTAHPEPAGWEDARRHLAACPECRRRALAIDPTLVFLDLGADPEALPGDETKRIRESVHGALRARRAERASRGGRRWFGSAAAALALLLGALWLAGDGTRSEPPAPVAAQPEGMRFGELTVPALEPAAPPLVEAIDRPQARIYQLPQDDLSLVMIVDESLDV